MSTASTKRTAGKATRAARRTNRAAKHAASNTVFEDLVRWGYVVRGLLYAGMAATGLLLTAGLIGHASDQKSSLAYLPNNPIGASILIAAAIVLAAYAIWGVVRAIYDPLRRGQSVPGVLARLGFAWSGLAYGALCIAIVQYLAGAGGALKRDSLHAAVASAMTHPFGQAAIGASGFIAVAAGLAQFADAVIASFAEDLQRYQMSEEAYQVAVVLGRAGFFSRGVIFSLSGVFILQSGLSGQSSHARGFGSAFDTLLGQPFGHVLVGLVSLGFIALALHSFFYARYVRTLSSRR